jgi:hypothetical protein
MVDEHIDVWVEPVQVHPVETEPGVVCALWPLWIFGPFYWSAISQKMTLLYIFFLGKKDRIMIGATSFSKGFRFASFIWSRWASININIIAFTFIFFHLLLDLFLSLIDLLFGHLFFKIAQSVAQSAQLIGKLIELAPASFCWHLI